MVPALQDSKRNNLSLSPVESATHVIMFWTLIAMAVALFLPCVLVPVWVENEAVREHERLLSAHIAGLNRQADRNEERINAMLTDPLVNQRIIRRDFNYRSEDEQVVRVSTVGLGFIPSDPPRPPVNSTLDSAGDDTLPAMIASVNRWLPHWPWRKLFADYPCRYVFLLMAGGLLVSAFLLFGPVKNELQDECLSYAHQGGNN